jgi:tetratricopeptide (TPR) repeat protein
MSNSPFYRIRYCRCSPLLVVFFLTAFSPAKQAACAEKQRHATAIEQADKAFWNMNYQKADSVYTSELRRNPENAELLWRLARLQISLGESVENGKTDERLLHYRKAMEYAKTGITLDSTNGKGHSWYAASLGLMADKIGTKEKLTRASEIKRELDWALRLNPNDETALSILGSYYREAAKIGWFRRMMGNAFIGEVPKGNLDMAEKAFRKAITIDARVIRNYHELALILIERGNKEEAIGLMKIALDKPVIMASDKKRIEEMRSLLRRLSEE